jgi:hypothetical protein
MSADPSDQQGWRNEMLTDLASGDLPRATQALLSLTYDDQDRVWIEDLLLKQLDKGNDPQLRALAVTCMGHLGRMRGVVSKAIAVRLEELLDDPDVGGIAEDALGDVKHFAKIV